MTMAGEQEQASTFWREPRATALLVLANGMVVEGFGLGATGAAVGEVCFNTAMTGYQEILTDPSYAGQIVTFTFPHIGNTGANDEDIETSNLAASAGVRGIVVHAPVTGPSNHRAKGDFNAWLKSRGIVGLYGLDTRALTAFIRENGMPNAVIAHSPSGDFDIDGLRSMARGWPGLEGMDLVPEVSAAQRYDWTQAAWVAGQGFRAAGTGTYQGMYKVVAIDYGIKRNILRLLTEAGCAVTVVPAQTPAESILAMRPDGVFLSNGPGDPAALGYAHESVRGLIGKKPIFGICLGHQILGYAFGGSTFKLKFGHRGANQPVKDLRSGKVAITSQNHGFAVDSKSLPSDVEVTHVNLNDGTVEGMRHKELPIFSVQYHPEAAPGPHDASYFFAQFAELIEKQK